ncbi:MAG: hypothetical protein JXR69_01495 [Candidatus Delongbacteria bacterium]|nr:hypothetical protein [Candidatus Delongbacteria bacterium]
MDKLVEKLKKIDKRWIYLLIFLSCILPFFPGFEFLNQEFSETKETIAFYDNINELKEGDAVFIDWAFDPTTQAELLPMAEQTLKQCFDKKLRVFIYFPFLTGISLGENALAKLQKEPGYEYIEEGVHYQNLGYLPLMTDMLLFSMYSDFKGTFGKEGKIFKGLNTFADIKYVMCFSGSSWPESYILLQRRFGFKMQVGVTAVIGPDYIPFLQTGQLQGMLFGLKGAAEYENIRVKAGSDKKFNRKANAGMASLTLSHLVMFMFIAIGNLIYLFEKKVKKI